MKHTQISLPKYNPKDFESKLNHFWRNGQYFSHQHNNNKQKEDFCIQLPPPNITGTLHMGHAYNQTIIDALIRFNKIQGKNVCWIAGTDHAGIATQIVVERQLASQGINKHDLSRQEFIDKIWDWKNKSGRTIIEQIKSLGCSIDWQREYFTLDEKRSKIVNKAFVTLYNQGLIYRGKRLVNWDCVLKTAISDLEVENIETNGYLYHIAYSLLDNSDKVIIATTRPETLLGDIAVAVNPNDTRYQHLIGKELSLPLTSRKIPIIADEYVDMDFGTGCVKITPAHDFNDYDIGKRHNLKLINILDIDGKIKNHADVYSFGNEQLIDTIELPKEYVGMDRLLARDLIVKHLEQHGLLLKKEEYKTTIPKGDRTGTIIEPMLTDQWFIDMNSPAKNGAINKSYKTKDMSLAEKAKYAVDSGKVTFYPDNWKNTYNQWMNNIQDWCISRQLQWGHQIPVWYDENGNYYVAETEEQAYQQAGNSVVLIRDNDVLDTWFSSGLIPFSTLNFKNEETLDINLSADDFKRYLPSSTLVTGHEIIFFWIARMIFLTMHFTDKVPFKDIVIHGIVRDNNGKKMSKSEGNVIDPMDLINGIDLNTLLEKRTIGLRKPETAPVVKKETEKIFPNGISAIGADALRLTMASYANLGRSVDFDFQRANGYRNFCNKIWNATNFVLMNLDYDYLDRRKNGQLNQMEMTAYETFDFWILSKLSHAINKVNNAYETYRLDIAIETLYDFFWHDFCDYYIEHVKVYSNFLQNDPNRAEKSKIYNYIMLIVLENFFKLLHPIAPFITEELWQVISPIIRDENAESIVLSGKANIDDLYVTDKYNKEAEMVINSIKEIRQLRSQFGLKANEKAILLVEENKQKENYLPYLIPYFELMAQIKEVKVVAELPNNALIATHDGFKLSLEVVNNTIDINIQIKQLNHKLEKVQKAYDKIVLKLNQEGYIHKAPKHLIEKDKAELQSLEIELKQLQDMKNSLI